MSEDLAGMTVNERLFHAGLLEAFDEAARAQDWERMKEILQQVLLSPERADAAVSRIRRQPQDYGY